MKRLLVGIAVMLFGSVSLAANDSQVDQSEVLRLGNFVQHIDGKLRSDGADQFVDAMAPPESDADKWFISVITMRGCGGCQQLKKDWTEHQALLALANPEEPKFSWAHLNYYGREDRSQQFRFENIQITAYPTIIVQPPRSGRFGDPRTVVYQGVYGGEPQKLADQIIAAIRKYVSKLRPLPQAEYCATGSIGIDPPWQPAPQQDPYLPNVNPVFPNIRPLVPPLLDERPRLFEIPWGGIFTALATGVGIPVPSPRERGS
jgi:hypothetical protein